MVRNGPQRSQRVIVHQTFLYQQNLSKLAQNCAKISNLPFSKEVLLSKQSPISHLLRFHENFSNFCANIVIVKYTIFPHCVLHTEEKFLKNAITQKKFREINLIFLLSRKKMLIFSVKIVIAFDSTFPHCLLCSNLVSRNFFSCLGKTFLLWVVKS